MQLIDFLQLEERALLRERRPAVDFCQQAWDEFLDEDQDAITARLFAGWFDELLSRCERAHLEYSKIYFWRMKQMKDGRWRPPIERLEKTRQ